MSGEMVLPTCCGDGGAVYPCVRRYCHRRLLTFLWLQGFQDTHGSMMSETDAMMWVPHLNHFALHDQWQDANRYLSRFLALDTRRRTSVEGMVLSRVCTAFSTLANIVGGGEDDLSKQYLDHKRTICHGQIRLRSIILNLQQARASIDWERVKKKAAEILEELAFATPELKDLTLMPGGANEAAQCSSHWLRFPPEVSPKETDPAAKIPYWSCQELPCEMAQTASFFRSL